MSNDAKNLMSLLTAFITAANYEITAELTEEQGVFEYTCTRNAKKARGAAANSYTDDFSAAWMAMPKREGGNSKVDASRAYQARIREGIKPSLIIDGILRYHAYVSATDKINTELTMSASRFFGTGENYLQDWKIPAVNKYTLKLPGNNESLSKFASDNDLPVAGPGESWIDYRHRLQGKIDAINGNN